MTSKDMKTKLAPVQLFEPQDGSDTDVKTSLLDTQGFESATVLVNIGTITGVDGSNYLTPKLQESDTTADADFTDVAAGDMIGAFTAVNSTSKDQCIQMVGYKGNKRYVRVFMDWTGTAVTTALVSVTGILADARDLPAVAPAPVSAT